MAIRSSKNGRFYIDDDHSPRWLSPAAAGNFTVSSANTAVQLTIAAVSGCSHELAKFIVSFSADPSAAVPITICDGSTAVGTFYVTKSGPAPIDTEGMVFTAGNAFSLQLGAAGGTTTGAVAIVKRRVVNIGKD